MRPSPRLQYRPCRAGGPVIGSGEPGSSSEVPKRSPNFICRIKCRPYVCHVVLHRCIVIFFLFWGITLRSESKAIFQKSVKFSAMILANVSEWMWAGGEVGKVVDIPSKKMRVTKISKIRHAFFSRGQTQTNRNCRTQRIQSDEWGLGAPRWVHLVPALTAMETALKARGWETARHPRKSSSEP